MASGMPSDLERKFGEFRKLADQYWALLGQVENGTAPRNAAVQVGKIREEIIMLKPEVEDGAAAMGMDYQPIMRAPAIVGGYPYQKNYFAAVYEDLDHPFHPSVTTVRDFLTECIARAKKGPAPVPQAFRNPQGGRIAIGHGHSLVWRELKDFLKDELHLAPDEYSMVATAGYSRKERLQKMLEEASFAFLIMTAEDEQADGELRARQNVIHETGLFQGRLSFEKAIVMLEDGCAPFSNIDGLDWIAFSKGKIGSAFEEVRRVLKREGLLS